MLFSNIQSNCHVWNFKIFNDNALHFQEWISTMVRNNTSIPDTHRITYLQNSLSGKAKDLVHAYSCDPSFYQTALNELLQHFSDCTINFNAFNNQLENWQKNYQNKQSLLAFSLFLKKKWCKPSITLALQQTCSLQHSLRQPQRKHHTICSEMERTLFTELNSDPTFVDIQHWLELYAQIYDKVSRESNQRAISCRASKFVKAKNLQTKQYNSNLSVSINNASPENSRKHRNFAPQ